MVNEIILYYWPQISSSRQHSLWVLFSGLNLCHFYLIYLLFNSLSLIITNHFLLLPKLNLCYVSWFSHVNFLLCKCTRSTRRRIKTTNICIIQMSPAFCLFPLFETQTSPPPLNFLFSNTFILYSSP